MNDNYRRQLQEAYRQGYHQQLNEFGPIVKGIGRGLGAAWDWITSPGGRPDVTPKPNSVRPGIIGKAQWEKWLNIPGLPPGLRQHLSRLLSNPTAENWLAFNEYLFENFQLRIVVVPRPGNMGLMYNIENTSGMETPEWARMLRRLLNQNSNL